MNLNLFDKAGRFTAPDAAILAALTDPERNAIARIADAANLLDAANLAAQENSDALKLKRDEIAALEKKIPKLTFNDLAKAMAADTQKRRAGL